MSSGWEKSVKGGCKAKLAAPKSKYVEHILVATHNGEAAVAEVFRALQNRLRDSTWVIVFKALIIVHLMMREGKEDVTLMYLQHNPARKLAINNFTEVQPQGRNVRTYADYLVSRAVSYADTKVDYIRNGEHRLKTLKVDKGLLRETESVQDQIHRLVKCDFLTHEPENEISLTAFRLCTMDLLALYHVMNEGTINVLEHFFEMSKTDADRALSIYRTFVKQTIQVVKYLSIAKNYEYATRLDIPKIKHAPTGLAGSLEEYLKDPDFETNRRQYIAQKKAKKAGKIVKGNSKPPSSQATTKSSEFPSPSTAPASGSGPTSNTVAFDLLGSIEQQQETMQSTPYQQQPYQQPGFAPQMMNQNGFSQTVPFQMQATGIQMPQQPFAGVNGQATNPFMRQVSQPMQMDFTGFAASPQFQQQRSFSSPLTTIPQSGAVSFSQPPTQSSFLQTPNDPNSIQSKNPFRQSILNINPTGLSMGSFHTGSTGTPLSAQSTNPFSKPSNSTPPMSSSPFNAPQQPLHQQQFTSAPMAAPLAATPTGTNPFARQSTTSPFQSAPPQGPIASNPTGSTNPFRQQQGGPGWIPGTQGTIGGISSESVETVPIFRRG